MKTTMYIDAVSIDLINKHTGKIENRGGRSNTTELCATTVRMFPDDIAISVNLEDSTRNGMYVDPFDDYGFTLYWFPEGTEVELL